MTLLDSPGSRNMLIDATPIVYVVHGSRFEIFAAVAVTFLITGGSPGLLLAATERW